MLQKGDSMLRKTVRLDYRVRPPRPGDPHEARAGRDERYRVLLDAGELVVLHRDGAGAADDGGRVLMAGEVLSPSTVLEVVNLIASSRWVGTLQVFGADAHRTLGFSRGVLRHAKSDHPEDRLDKVLCRAGALSPTEVESAMRDIRPDQRLGEVLVERRVLSRQQLFTHLEKQMEEILLAAVLEEAGCYLFTVDDEPDPPPSATVHIPVQHLILTAAERVDNMDRFRRLIPDLEMCPEIEPGVEVTRLDADSRLVVGYCTGRRSVREIASETWLGRYQTAAVLYRLLRDGHARLAPPRRTAREEAARLVGPFNELLREIWDAIETWGDRRRARREVAAWIADDADRELLRTALDGDGLIDPTAIAEALVEPTADQQLDAARSTLTELTAYALCTASLWLPREVERDLARRVNERLQTAG
jgi:Domain of unknown function (DUF4388)